MNGELITANLSEKSESGMVTVETAISLGAVVTVLVALLLALSATTTQGQLCEAVRVGARAQSLGADAQEAAARVIGKPIDLTVVDAGETFTVIGVTEGLKLGKWSVGGLSCKVSGIKETYWAGLP